MPAITPERPDTPDASALIGELEAYLEPLYPRESRHGYSVEKLIAEGVAFFLIRDDGVSVGCGGIQLMGTEYGEIKRMYVRPECRGKGFAKLMLDHLAEYVRSHEVGTLCLELASISTKLSRYMSKRALSGFHLLESTRTTRSAGSTKNAFSEFCVSERSRWPGCARVCPRSAIP